MYVGIDVSNLHEFSKLRGIGVYAKNLYEAIRKYTNINVKLVEDSTNEKFDLIHYPYFDFFASSLPLIKKYPTVVTIHDLIPLIFPKFYPPGIKGSINLFRQKVALKNVKAIISVSTSTKGDIEKILKINPGKIFTVYSAPAENFKKIENLTELKSIKKKYNLPNKFALFVGSVNWNKNLINLTQACIDAKIDLYLVGSGFNIQENLNHPELAPLKEFRKKYSDNKFVHVVNFVTGQKLVGLYNLASCLLIPSFYEGFGLPILEAQSCGTPVITSNNSSMPEIAGEGAILVNPENPDEISKAITKVTSDVNLKTSLIRKGFENVKKYSWEKTAKDTVKVYEKIS